MALLAASSSSLAAPGDDPTLVLGVSQNGKLDSHLTKVLGERLQHNGENVLSNAQLSSTDRQCLSAECFDKVAEREGARLLLTTALQQNGTNNYFITAVLYDAEKHVPYQETASCDCLSDALAVKVSDMADKLLKDYRQRAASPSILPTPPGPGPGGTGVVVPPLGPLDGSGGKDTKQGARFSLSPQRKVLLGVFGGIGAAALITAIALHAVDGNRTSSTACNPDPLLVNDHCILKTLPGYATGYALAGGAAIGIGLVLLWPQSAPAKTSEAR